MADGPCGTDVLTNRRRATGLLAEIIQRHAVEVAESSDTDEDCAGVQIRLNLLHPQMSGSLEKWELFPFCVQAVDVEAVAGGE